METQALMLHARANAVESTPRTFPAWVCHHAQTRGDKPAMREKDLGIWQTYTWSQVYAGVRAIACGLAQRGFVRGDRLAIIGDNRPRLYWSMLACQSLGGIPVLLYQDAIAEEIAFVLQDVAARFAVVEDQEQVDKLLEVQDQIPALAHILVDDPRGLRHYAQPQLAFLDAVQHEGSARDQADVAFLDAQIAQGKADDVAVILYTSGTTGKPKGVCQTHGAFVAAAQGGIQFEHLTPDEVMLAYLPMAWVGDHLFSVAQATVAGFCINCPESAETVMTDMREIGPTYYFAPPRIFEAMRTQTMIRMEDAGRLKRALFRHFMEVARRCGAQLLDGQRVAWHDRVQYALGRWLVYAPLKNVLGLSRIRIAYTAGAAIGPDLFRFYRSIGVNLKQLYGQTETCAYACLQPDGEVKLDSVGKPAPGVEVKLSESGEILLKGAMVFQSYWNRPEATAESFNAAGYFMTGDAGFFDDAGHLKIIDRVKDVGKLNHGAMFAPNYIENKLKFVPYIKEAVAFGHGRDTVCVFINIDLDAVGDWAERRNIAYSGYADLAQQPQVYALVRECLESINVELAQDTVMCHSQVHRFLILHKELDADDGELTRTRKLRRNVIAERYGVLIAALYDPARNEQYIETSVQYEDGRQGAIAATLRLESVKTFDPSAPARAA